MMARGKSANRSDRQWLNARRRDPYCRRARQSHYRSRAVYKLQQIDSKAGLFQAGQHVLDLGAAPGGWSQYARERVGPRGRVIAVDMRPMQALDGVSFIVGDFGDEAVRQACLEQLGGPGADLVISDLAPNLSGIRASDQARGMALAEAAHDFCRYALKPGGRLLVKLFEGAGAREYRRRLKEHFAAVLVLKPEASRARSREYYVLAGAYGSSE